MNKKQACSIFAAFACMAAVGCDNTSTNPAAESQTVNNHGKTPTPLSCQTFSGIQHCTIGGASLTLNPSDLTVSSMGSGGTDGVSSSFVAADEWRQSATVQYNPGGGDVLTYTGYTSGTVNATMNISQSITTPSWLIYPTFTASPGGSNFTVEVFNGTTSQGSQSGISGTPTARVQVPGGSFSRPQTSAVVWSQSPVGRCKFSLKLPSAVVMTLPNGNSYTGDLIEFSEDLLPGGHYPYTGATSMDVQSNVSSYVITAEAIIPH